MENIEEILKGIGITIPEDKKESFNELLSKNYKTVAEVSRIKSSLEQAKTERDTYKTKYETDIAQRDTDLAELKEKLEKAGADNQTVEQLTKDLQTLQTTYETAKTTYEDKLKKQSYEFAVKEKTNELNFSSVSAKKAFISELLNNPLNIVDGQLMGFNDFVDAYKKQDEKAFISETGSNGDGSNAAGTTHDNPPMFSTKTTKVTDEQKTQQDTKKVNPTIW